MLGARAHICVNRGQFCTFRGTRKSIDLFAAHLTGQDVIETIEATTESLRGRCEPHHGETWGLVLVVTHCCFERFSPSNFNHSWCVPCSKHTLTHLAGVQCFAWEASPVGRERLTLRRSREVVVVVVVDSCSHQQESPVASQGSRRSQFDSETGHTSQASA